MKRQHNNRHTFASYLVSRGCVQSVDMVQCGWRRCYISTTWGALF